jgi:hypothetical protein
MMTDVPVPVLAEDESLVSGGIHISATPEFDHSILYHECVVRRVANNSREDEQRFPEEAALISVHTRVQVYRFDQVNDALVALKTDVMRSAGVIVVAGTHRGKHEVAGGREES